MTKQTFIENYQRLNEKYEELFNHLTKCLERYKQIIKLQKAQIEALETQRKILLDVADKGLLSNFHNSLILRDRKPVLRHLNNANLYTGQEAIDKILEMHTSGLRDLVAFIAHMGDWKGYRESFFIADLRKIDKYPDHVDLYTNIGILPIYVENPISTYQVVEMIEIPADYERLIRMYLERKARRNIE